MSTMRSLGLALLLYPLYGNAADERRNLSISDLIYGFQGHELVYYEVLLHDGVYQKTLNRCLSSRPGHPDWIRQHCWKNHELKNAFQCADDQRTARIWFVYESDSQCEELRRQMKDRMDAYRQQ